MQRKQACFYYGSLPVGERARRLAMSGELVVRRFGLWPAKFLVAVALLLVPFSLVALDPAKSVFQFNCQSWNRQNGLPAGKISSITQTKDGDMWLGTQNGLMHFDGIGFTAVPIKLSQAQGQDVRKLCRSRDGGLWFAIDGGGYG